jgi:hypothetical protein
MPTLLTIELDEHLAAVALVVDDVEQVQRLGDGYF